MSIARKTVTALLAFALVGAVAPAMADMLKYKAELSGAQEVPPTDSKGVGAIEATYDTATKTLTWSGSYVSGTARPIGLPPGVARAGYDPRLKREGIQNCRMASTMRGMSRQAVFAKASVLSPRSEGGRTGRPAASVQWNRIGSNKPCSTTPGASMRDQSFKRSFTTA